MNHEMLDKALAELQGHKTTWARLPIRTKRDLLADVRTRALANAQRWVDAEVAAKALAPDSPLIGAESWVSGPYALESWLSASIQTLEALDHGQDPLAQVTTHANADGTTATRVLPTHPYERLLFNGITADVWMQPGVTADNLRENTAGF
jgi:aldehyde dehydrogenase (NAD(P)+)